MDGAKVGENALVAALAFVPAAGSPAERDRRGSAGKVLRDLTQGEKDWMKVDSNLDYLKLRDARSSWSRPGALTEKGCGGAAAVSRG